MNKLNEFKSYAQKKIAGPGMAVDRFPWESKEAYADWLAQTYYFVRHSTRLLCCAGARFTASEDELHLRFLEHLREEKNHDKLALSDLKHLGVDIRDYPEHPETRAFYQPQYYLIEHVSPKALFGYILALEGLTVLKGTQIYENLHKVHGEKAAVFMKVHALEDHDHVEKLYAQLSNLPKQDLLSIQDNLDQSCALYCLMMDKIVKRVTESNPSRYAA